MMFCPKCGSILVPKKDGKKTILSCSCGYTNKKEKLTITEKIEKPKEIETIEHEPEIHPLTDDVECPKCGHDHAYYWTIQTRASDEPATKFMKCQKCKHIWRDYK